MPEDIISVNEAKTIIENNVSSLLPIKLPLQKAAGLLLAENVFAAINIPAFPQSSVDGYAISFHGWKLNKRLKITGVVAAGNKEKFILNPENALRIFTGAAVPQGADTVVMQEKIKIDSSTNSEDVLIIEDENLKAGMYVRAEGSEIKKGALAMPENSLLTPAAIGFLAGIGIDEIVVYPKPAVSIIITGNELQQPGQPLGHGQVYEANSYSLKAALQQLQICDVKIFNAADDVAILSETLKQALQQSDVVFLTGGISVGDFDFVLQASINNGVQKLFHKIKQRPAKPLYFGKKENKYVFGLPGNPSSALVSFYEYILPALNKMSAHQHNLQTIMVPLMQAFKKPAGLVNFLKGFYDGKTATVSGAQESYRMSSFAKANCLIKIDEEVTEMIAGEMVEIHLLPL